jgi:AraC-like DNA-binding protein
MVSLGGRHPTGADLAEIGPAEGNILQMLYGAGVEKGGMRRLDPARGIDPSGPVDIGCGTLIPVRSSRFSAMLDYTHDFGRAPARVDAKQFEFNVIVFTTRGRWLFHGDAGRAEIDSSSLMVGVASDVYGCQHDRRVGDSNIIVALRPGAIDPDLQPLFSRQIIPARGVISLLRRAARAQDDELFESLVFSVFDEASSISWRVDHSGAPDVRMQRAKRFIELHAFERLRLTDIASELGLSPFSTVRQFRAATGSTPYAYLLELRLKRAQELLGGTRTPVRAVGSMVGFADLAYFSRFFKAATGYSPSSYRAMRSAGTRSFG